MMTNGKVIPLPYQKVWQTQVKKQQLKRSFLLTLESLVTVAIGICAVTGTTVFLWMCM